MKKLKKRTIIILVVLFVFIVTIGVLVYRNRNTLFAVYYTATNQGSKLEKMKLDTDKRALEAIKEFGIKDVRPLSEEEEEQLRKGEITEEEAVDLVLGKKDSKTEATSGSAESASSSTGGKESSSTAKTELPTATDSGSTTDPNKEKNEEIAELIGELYVLKAKFSNDLSNVEAWVSEKYLLYTSEYGEGKIPSSIKTKVGKEAYAKATALETECDTKVNNILTRITTLLKETGQSTSVVDEIKAAYDNEKMLAKSYYMSLI